ncbi:MAG: PilZ domain-containing protein [Oligoflexales bacterium]|nr:PilZ domain-containing protein [Oligoflexales bacterium]
MRPERKYPRIQREYEVLHSKSSWSNLLIEPEKRGKICNLSAGGALLESHQPYLAGDLINLQIKISEWQKLILMGEPGWKERVHHFVALGRVVRVLHDMKGFFLVGVEYRSLDKVQKQDLDLLCRDYNF